MTGDDVEALCRTAGGRQELVGRLGPLDEEERARLAGAVARIVAFDRGEEFDGAAVAIAAIGVLSDPHQIAVWGVYFQEIAVEAEPLLVRALVDRAPRWERRFTSELLDERSGVWRLVWRLVCEGRIPMPESPDFLINAVWGLAGPHGAHPTRRRPVGHAMADEPELVDAIVWPVLTTQGTGRRLARYDEAMGGWGSPAATWTQGLLDAVARGAIDRGRLLDTALAAFLVDWPKVDQAWFLQLHEALAPDLQETVERSATYVRLPAAAYGPAAAMGQRRLRAFLEADLLSADEVLAASPPALLRAEKYLVLGQLALLEVVAAREPERAGAVAELAALATEHTKTDVQERARELAERLAPAASAPPGGEVAVAPPVAPMTRPEVPELTPVADTEELGDLLLRTAVEPSAVAIERVWEGLVRLGRRLPARDMAALGRSLSEMRSSSSGMLAQLRAVIWHLANDRPPGPLQPPSVAAYDADGTLTYAPRWRPEHVVSLRAGEIATMAYAGDAALLSFPSTVDGSLRLEDLRARLAALGSAPARPLDTGFAALRVHPDDRAQAASLRGTPAGNAIADRLDWLAARTTAWERVTWRLPWSRTDEPAVWQDARAAVGSPSDPVKALLDLRDMVSRFAESQIETRGPFSYTTVTWPLLLPHHPEQLAAHAHTRVVGALLPTVTTGVDANDSGAAPLLAAIGAAPTAPGMVACSALGYGLSAPAALDRTTATDALIELGTHGLLGSELGPQLALHLADGHVTGSRIAGALDDAARALGPLGGQILDTLEAVLSVMRGRRDAHLFVDLTGRLANELERTVVLPAPLRDLAATRARSVLARACRRVPIP
jgi:Family of unknown function (DUF6493)